MKKDEEKLKKSSSDSDSKDESPDEENGNKIEFETEEKVEKNVIKQTKIINEIKTSIDKLSPKNQNGKFLMDE